MTRTRKNTVRMVSLPEGPHSKHIMQALKELTTQTDRGAAIIGASIVEIALRMALLTNMHKDSDITERLFRASGPLGSFSAKIDLGFLLGLYGDVAHRDLLTMKSMRNDFAHELSVSDFSDQSLSARCMNFKLVERHTVDMHSDLTVKPTVWAIGAMDRENSLKDPRERYLLTVSVLTMGLLAAHKLPSTQPSF